MKVLRVIFMFILIPVDLVIMLYYAIRVEQLRGRVEVLKDRHISRLNAELADSKLDCILYKQKLAKRKEK